MSNIINKNLVLCLNANWQPINITTGKRAFVALSAEGYADGEPPCFAMDLQLDKDGNLAYATPTSLEDWLELPVREGDLFIQTAHRKIRFPTVIIARNFNKVPKHRTRLSSGNIAKRDNGECQYTGRKLTRAEMTLDHVIPRARGGKDTWENLVLCDREINERKADRLPHEAGLKLLKQPKAPLEMPVIFYKDQAAHSDWLPFLTAKANN